MISHRKTLYGNNMSIQHPILSGKEFNTTYPDTVFVKLTNEVECHNGFQFKDGLNIDTIPFFPFGDCNPGGIYFCTYDTIHNWIFYGITPMYWVRTMIIPDNAKVYIETGKFKADKIILGERKCIWEDVKICLTVMKINGYALQYVKNQTEEICKVAVSNHHNALQFVKEQTDEICMIAIKKNGGQLIHVNKQTHEICLAAVQNCGYVLEFVKQQTSEICLAAVQQWGGALKFVKEKTPEIRMAAIQRDPCILFENLAALSEQVR